MPKRISRENPLQHLWKLWDKQEYSKQVPSGEAQARATQSSWF